MGEVITFFLWKRGLFKQDDCLEIQSEPRDGILYSAENDRYHECAGDAVKKCLIESIEVSEHEEGDPEAGDDADDDYIRCIEEQTKPCNYRIMHHFFEQIEAYKKHVKQLEMLESEEQQG